MRLWDEERSAAAKRYEQKGQPVPQRLQLDAAEFEAREAEEPRNREEDLLEEERRARVKMINGWLRQQFRLRLYYQKRIGKLKGNPQDLLVTFDAGPDALLVSVDDIEGLGYGAELEPDPEAEEEVDVEASSSKSRRDEL